MLKRILSIDNFILLVILLVMVNNVEHCAFVHYQVARRVFDMVWMNKAHSVAVVIIIELSIVVFVVKGDHKAALFFTMMLFVLSMLYYDFRTFWINAEYEKILAAVTYSTMFTASIYIFSRMYAAKRMTNAEHAQLQLELKRLRAYKNKRIKELTCGNCGRRFESDMSKIAHQRRCINKN